MDIPTGISQEAWDKARDFLSFGFTKPIGDQIEEVTLLAHSINNLMAYNYKIVTWHDFIHASDRPDGLMSRASDWQGDGSSFAFVVYDPLDDHQGFFLMGNDASDLAFEACEFIESGEPEEGPLSPDNIAMSNIEGN